MGFQDLSRGFSWFWESFLKDGDDFDNDNDNARGAAATLSRM